MVGTTIERTSYTIQSKSVAKSTFITADRPAGGEYGIGDKTTLFPNRATLHLQ